MWGLASFGLLILRLVVGLIFVAHGSQKLFGWLGGKGISGQTGLMKMLGVRPARLFALVSAAGEFFGGLGVAAGLLTPLAAAGILGSMIVAIVKVHWAKGFWNSGGGIEFPLILATASFVVGLVGPGVYSLDYALRLRLPEPLTYIIVLAVTVLVVIYAMAGPAPKKLT
jgi:putative oxidoreductase